MVFFTNFQHGVFVTAFASKNLEGERFLLFILYKESPSTIQPHLKDNYEIKPTHRESTNHFFFPTKNPLFDYISKKILSAHKYH